MAIMIRWRSPPLSWKVGNGGVPGLLPAHAQVEHKPLGHLAADGQQGVQGGHGLLKNHAHALAPQGVALLGGQGGQLLAVQLNAAGDHPPVVWHQVHNGKGGNAFAAARLAHHAQGLVFLNVEGDAAQHLVFLFVDPEGGHQILDLKYFFPHGNSS